jgi:hypothetical protein
VVNESADDWVAYEVAVGGEEVVVIFDPAREAVGAEEMGASPVGAVVLARVLGVQPLQRVRQARVRDRDERVVVVTIST